MPRELITLQIGQCGNQSEFWPTYDTDARLLRGHSRLCIPVIPITSRLRVLEAAVQRARHPARSGARSPTCLSLLFLSSILRFAGETGQPKRQETPKIKRKRKKNRNDRYKRSKLAFSLIPASLAHQPRPCPALLPFPLSHGHPSLNLTYPRTIV